ncbi:GNAT family N-acetyltransferase [Kitasatospora phosalacinea]|uniref:GNAT family N-acetyltransferase n=1 Tax=Kitasatospora phosalacinea TaxID=2065 RepID=UPI000527765C|nr:GNAT family N-acetyltransferase [Kitasatospora phosalacinea]
MPPIFPETVLRTDRLLLRPFTAADVEETRAACSDELTQQWLPLPRPYTTEDAAAWCTGVSHHLRTSGDGIHFAVADTDSGRLLGTVGLKKTDWPARVSEVGYWAAPWARGRGVMPEATRTVGAWLLGGQGFQRLQLFAATGNTASQRVAEKAGFQKEGVLRNAGYVHSGRVDLLVFSLVPDDLAGN